jgi:hypothetical protein
MIKPAYRLRNDPAPATQPNIRCRDGLVMPMLEKAGLISIEKGYEGRRARTWIHLTKAGNKALHNEIATLKNLIHQLETGTNLSTQWRLRQSQRRAGSSVASCSGFGHAGAASAKCR